MPNTKEQLIAWAKNVGYSMRHTGHDGSISKKEWLGFGVLGDALQENPCLEVISCCLVALDMLPSRKTAEQTAKVAEWRLALDQIISELVEL